jgi:hypothetical protein
MKKGKREFGFDEPVPMAKAGPGVAQAVRLYELYAAQVRMVESYQQLGTVVFESSATTDVREPSSLVPSVVRGAFEWLQVASTLPVDRAADAMVAQRLVERRAVATSGRLATLGVWTTARS